MLARRKFTATSGGKTANVEVRVLKDITSIAILDTNGKTMDNQELTVGGDELTAKAVVYPTKYKESAKSAVWSIEDKDVLDFGDTYIKWVDPDTGKLTTETATFKAVGAGTTKVTVTLGNQTDSFRVTVKNAAKTIKISKLVNISNLSATVRNGSETEIVSRMNANSKFSQSLAITDENETIYVPVRWVSAFKASNGKTATGLRSASDHRWRVQFQLWKALDADHADGDTDRRRGGDRHRHYGKQG